MESMRYTSFIKPHDTCDVWGSEVIAKEIFKLPHYCKDFVALRNCITPRGECHRYLLEKGGWLHLKCGSGPVVGKTIALLCLESKNDSLAFQPVSSSRNLKSLTGCSGDGPIWRCSPYHSVPFSIAEQSRSSITVAQPIRTTCYPV